MQTKTALVVDDSRVARLTLNKLLQAQGFDLTETGSAEEALDWLRQSQRLPDIIFMDVMMSGMDGLTATREIKAHPDWTAIPVIICTGKESDDELKQALASGASAVLAKPPAPEPLQQLLQDISLKQNAAAPAAEPTAEPSTQALVAALRAQLMPELEQMLNSALARQQTQLREQESHGGVERISELGRQLSDSVQQQFSELRQNFSGLAEQRLTETAGQAIDSAIERSGLNDKIHTVLAAQGQHWLAQQQQAVRARLEQDLKQRLQPELEAWLQQQLENRLPGMVSQTLQQQSPHLQQQQIDALQAQLKQQRSISLVAAALALLALFLTFV